ncbi:MAG: hypothetical protein O3C63_08465 [Cyanobacteria bacterium]|nr:hypothetical protein [Cyanobacteriota bacterium]
MHNRFLLLIIFFTSLNSSWADQKHYKTITRTGVGQLRLEQAAAKIPTDPEPPVCNVPPGNIFKLANGCDCDQPAVLPNGCPCINPFCRKSDPEPELQRLRMIVNAFPAGTFHGEDRLGIYYQSTLPISETNPVRIYNLKTGGYFSAYFDNESFLRFSVGTVPNSINGISPLAKQERVNLDNLDFQDAAVLETIYNPDQLDDYKLGALNEVTMDILPRFRVRYGLVTKTISINGIYIPAGSIVAGTRDDGIARPGFTDMTNLRFYSPDGVLLNVVPEKDKNKLFCGTVATAQCIDFDSHYTEPATTEFGAKVFAEYSTKDFFPGKDASQANEIWLDIQKDLEAQTVLGIFANKEPWQERIFKELNQQEIVYLSNLFANVTSVNALEALFGYVETDAFRDFSLLDASADSFTEFCKTVSAPVETDDRDTALNKAYDSMYCKLKAFSDAKLMKWDSQDNVQAVSSRNTAKAEYYTAFELYNHELKYGAIERKPTTISEVENPTATDDDEVDPYSSIPANCQKKNNRDTKACRQYYDAPKRCINNNGYLKKNDTSCHGYKSPGFAPEAPAPASVIKAPAPKPKPVAAPPKPAAKKPAKKPSKKTGKKNGK